MMITKIEDQVRYVTNRDGKTTDVLIPILTPNIYARSFLYTFK
jgi:hypothetical protein